MPDLNINGARVHYLDDRPVAADRAATTPILMLHGWARNGTFWNGWVARLTQRFRVLRPDLRGCGSNPDPGPDFVFRMNDVVADQVALLDALGIDAAHVIGESTGGLVTGFLAARHPERVRSATLISTPITAADANSPVMSPGSSSSVPDSLRELGLKEWWLQSRSLSNDCYGDERDDVVAAEFGRTPLHVAISMYEEMHSPEVTLAPLLGDIDAPVLVLTPGGSFLVSTADQARLVEKVRDVRQKIYPDAPHGMYFLRADDLSEDVLEFIEHAERVAQHSRVD